MLFLFIKNSWKNVWQKNLKFILFSIHYFDILYISSCYIQILSICVSVLFSIVVSGWDSFFELSSWIKYVTAGAHP